MPNRVMLGGQLSVVQAWREELKRLRQSHVSWELPIRLTQNLAKASSPASQAFNVDFLRKS